MEDFLHLTEVSQCQVTPGTIKIKKKFWKATCETSIKPINLVFNQIWKTIKIIETFSVHEAIPFEKNHQKNL